MDKIAKNMIPNANSAEKKPKAQCDIHKERYGSCVYFDTEMLPHVAHTFTKTLRVYNLRENTRCTWAGGTFFLVVLLCQFFGFWREIGFGVNYLHI
jgi:hypothetical protein